MERLRLARSLAETIESAPALSVAQAIEENGFVHLPDLLDASEVDAVRLEIRDALAAEGWIGGAGSVRRQEGSEGWWAGYARVQSIEGFHKLAHSPRLEEVLLDVLKEPLAHPRRPVSLIFPNFHVPPHQDYPVVQGTTRLVAAWVPLESRGPDAGGLRVFMSPPNSVLEMRSLPEAGVEIATDLPDFIDFQYRVGDVVLYHALVPHALTANRSSDVVISADYRYQPRRDAICDASLEPHHYPRVPPFDVLTQGWSSRRWVKHPRVVHRTRFIMPAQIERWHLDLWPNTG